MVGEVARDAPAGLDLPRELAGDPPPCGVLRKGEPAAGRIDVNFRRPDFEPVVWEVLDRGQLSPLVHSGIDALTTTVSRTEQEWRDWLSDKAGVPFSDVGPERTIAFHALGVRWTIHGRNQQDAVLAMEDFASTLQILLVEFASLDPVMIQQDVDIDVRAYPGDRRPIEPYMTRLDDDRRLWLLLLPAETDNETDDEQRVRHGVLHLAFQVLLGQSLLDREPFSDLMELAARNGLFQNLEIGRPYRELAWFRTQPIPPLADARHRPLAHPDRPNPRAGSPHLAPRSGPGPGYRAEKATRSSRSATTCFPYPSGTPCPNCCATSGCGSSSTTCETKAGRTGTCSAS